MNKKPCFFAMFALLVPFLIAWSPPIPGPQDPQTKARKKVEYLCQATGEFNTAPNGETLYMETWCVERYPPSDRPPRLKIVDDRVIQREKASKGPANMFRVPFVDTVVSLETRGNQKIVKVHYRDDQDAFHTLRLSPRSDKKYNYDFSKLVMDPATGTITIRAESETRWLEP